MTLITIKLDVFALFLYKKIHSIEYFMAHAPRYYFCSNLISPWAHFTAF